MTSREAIKKLKAAGWHLLRVKGSHHHFAHSDKSGIVSVPHPCKEMKLGLIKGLEKQSGVKLR